MARKKKETGTKVIFRAFKGDGDVIAVFPELPGGMFGNLCACYQHIGQHGDADIGVILRRTRPTTRDESAALRKELEGIGYKLAIRKRFIRAYDTVRYEAHKNAGKPAIEPKRSRCR